MFLQPARPWGQGWCWAPGPRPPSRRWPRQPRAASAGCSCTCTRTGRWRSRWCGGRRAPATKGSSSPWTPPTSAGASPTCATSSSSPRTSGTSAASVGLCRGCGGRSLSWAPILWSCASGWVLPWVTTKLSWLSLHTVKEAVPGNVRLQPAEVRNMGHFFMHVAMCSWLSSNLSLAQPGVTCSVELGSSSRNGWKGSERGLDFVGQNSLLKDVLVPSVLSYDTALGPGPCCYWLQNLFSNNFNSFTQIQKHVGISLSKFSMRAIFTLKCVLGHFLCLRISGVMIDFSTNSSSSPLQGQWGLQF